MSSTRRFDVIEDVHHGKIVSSDPRERRRPHDGALAAAGARAGDRRASSSPAACRRTRPRCPGRSGSTSAAAASCPASPTRTCTSRPGRWRSTRCGSRAAQSLEEAVARVRDALGTGDRLAPRPRLAQRRLVARGRADEADLDAIAPDRPVALMARDSHSVWLNSAALARANGDLQVPGGVVELDERGEPTGVLREESCWHFRDRYIETTDDEYVEAMRAGVRLAASRGRHRTSTTRTAGSARCGSGSGSTTEGALCLRGLAVAAGRLAPSELAQVDVRSGLGGAAAARRLPEGVHGRHARLADRADARRLRASRSRAARSSRSTSATARAPASRSPCTRSATCANREALDAFEATRESWQPLGLRQRIEHAQLLGARGRAALRRARRRRLGAVQPRAVRPRPRRPLLGRPRQRAVRVPLAARLGRRARERLRRADRGARPAARESARASLRTLDEREAWRPEQALTVEQALHATTVAPAWLARDERRRGQARAPATLADLVVLDRDPLACEPERAGRGAGRRDDARRHAGRTTRRLGELFVRPLTPRRPRRLTSRTRQVAAAFSPLLGRVRRSGRWRLRPSCASLR